MSFKHIALLLTLTIPALSGCSDTPPPAGNGTGSGDFEGTIDPGSESFVLRSLEVPNPPGTPIRIELIGRFAPLLELGRPALLGEILLLVKVRNADTRTLFAPGEIVVSGFDPSTVAPEDGNPDWITCPGDSTPSTEVRLDDCLYGYDYSDLLGPDGKLDPGESSGEKLWIFMDPDMVSFAFHARARFALEPDQPRIAGIFYADENRNGRMDPEESPFGGGAIHVSGPDLIRDVEVGGDGRYSIAVRQPGLYTLWASPPPTFAPVEPTTDNPLEVVLTLGADGAVQSYLHADFGWANAFLNLVHPIQFAPSKAGLKLDPYNLVEAKLDGQVLRLRVGFSGCSPEQPFQLYMIGDFMPHDPPPAQALLVLAHDDRGEECDAAFARDLAFDVGAVLQQFGDRPDATLLFESWNGEIQSFYIHGPTPGDPGP